ncbi:MAG TPA: methylated-DNA--[protein]-cysteine S-methyltransferase [Gaiellaceae bacterium]|nr:methylated-DNA--[protein]-cysteine S-methyltransferase [Gaiellaceae bacterium]
MAVAQVVYEAEGWGTGELVVEDGLVLWHELPWPRAATASGTPSPTPTRPGHGAAAVISANRSPRGGGFVAEVVRLLQAYFAGATSALDEVPVDLEYESPFAARCAAALRGIPRGEVVTYGELAALAGAPRAARAAGTFCARNRLGLFVPCHRVVAADGLGSYGSYGVAYKRRLLRLEGARDAV